MTNASVAHRHASVVRPRPVLAILVGGLIVGVLDLAYAIVVYSPRNPMVIPQGIASGVLGVKSYSGGARTAALGVLLHFVIALGAAAVYYLASRKLTLLVRRAVFCGLIYGALVYVFMNWVVLPLSAFPYGHTPTIFKVEFVWHWFGVGLPISLSVRHYSGLRGGSQASGPSSMTTSALA
jgi:uncharacterized membrane protein YagU involved in acid resistance